MDSTSTEGFIDSGFVYRTHSIRAAEMCRLCLKQRYLVDINAHPNLMNQLRECFPNFLHDDQDLPPFVCGECYQLIGITCQFTLRSTRTQVLLQSYVQEGGAFPQPEMLERVYQRAEKRSAPAEKEDNDARRATKKRRSSEESLKEDKKQRKSSKPTDKKEQTTTIKKKQRSKRTSEESTKKKKVKDYYRSDEFLFGEEINLEDAKKCDSSSNETESVETVHSDLQTDAIANNLPNMSLKMSYEEMMKVIETLQCIEQSKNC